MRRVIILGASGDLARRKLFPALAKIDNDDLEIVAYARSDLGNSFTEHISKFYEYSESFISRIRYISGPYDNLSSLKSEVTEDTIFYLSVPPHVYSILIGQLMRINAKHIAIEKPFGVDLPDFQEIKAISSRNPQSRLYFIDHYLYKPMTVAIPKLFSMNSQLSRLICGENIKSVEIFFKEELGAEGRGYFNTSGLIRDVVQNHCSEMLAVIAVRSEDKRAELFESASKVDLSCCALGQYTEYQRELQVRSSTETFAAIPLYFGLEKWQDVPFLIIAGKGLNEKRAEIRCRIRGSALCQLLIAAESIKTENEMLEIKSFMKNEEIEDVFLIFNYSPRNEVYIVVHAEEKCKELILWGNKIIMNLMEEINGAYTDHEIVFEALVHGKPLSCANLREVEALWKVFNPQFFGTKGIFYYEKGAEMPEEAENIIRSLR